MRDRGQESPWIWGQESLWPGEPMVQGTGQPAAGDRSDHGLGPRSTGTTSAGDTPDPSFSQFLPPSLPSLQWFHRRGCPCAGTVQHSHPTAAPTPCPHPQQHEPREHWWHWCDELRVLRAGPDRAGVWALIDSRGGGSCENSAGLIRGHQRTPARPGGDTARAAGVCSLFTWLKRGRGGWEPPAWGQPCSAAQRRSLSPVPGVSGPWGHPFSG